VLVVVDPDPGGASVVGREDPPDAVDLGAAEQPVPPASQTSPSRPGTASKRTLPVGGRPVAAEAVKLAPPLVLT